jgi:hypothetical protein
MDWKNLGEDAELKLKMDLEQPSSLMALISILKSKGVLTEEDMTAFNERQKYIQNLMFETSKAVGMVMVLQEEGEDKAEELLWELDKVVAHGKRLMEMCGNAGMAGELQAALEQAKAGLDAIKDQSRD